MRAKRSAAAPESRLACSLTAAYRRRSPPPGRDQTFGAERQRDLVQPRRRCAGQVVERASHLDRIAGARRQRLVHVGQSVLTRARRRCRRRRSARQRHRQLGRWHKAPEPTLTSITSASSPAASFLERMDAVISRIDSTVAVTSRAVDALVGRREVGGLADDRRSRAPPVS